MWVMGRVGMVLGFSLTLACASAAGARTLADEGSTAEEKPQLERAERWYGWQTLVVDGGATAVFVGGLAVEGEAYPTAPILGALGFAVGGPIVHAVHDRGWTSLGSLALRIALPGVATFVGAQFSNLNPCADLPGSHCDEGNSTPLIAGALIGMGAASVIDAAVLAYEPTPRATNESPYGVLPPLRIVPRLGLSRGALSLGLVGAF